MSSSSAEMASGNGNGDSSNTEMIQPGTLLLKCDPLVYVGHLAPPILCDTCLVMDAAVEFKLKRCSLCHVVYYCNAECQKRGWKEHKYECKHLMSFLLGPPSLDSNSANKLAWPRLLLRLVLKLQDGKDYYDELDIDGAKVKRRFDDLINKLDCPEARKKEDHKAAVDSIIRIVKYMLRDNRKIQLPYNAQLRKMSEKILTNTTQITNKYFYRVGSGVYLGSSVLEHSCKGMASTAFEGSTLYVRNMVEIPKSLPISKVTMSHLGNTLMPTEERKRVLMERWYLDCKCEMCQVGEGENDIDKEIRSLICPKKGCNAEMDSKEMRNPCSTCGHVMKEKVIAKLLEAEADVRKLLKGENDLELETIEAYIKKLKKNHFSDKHWLMLRLFDKAMTNYTAVAKDNVNIEDFEKAYQYGSMYFAVAVRFYQPNDLELLRILMDLAASSYALDKDEESETYLLQAKSIAEVIFGKDSDFIKTRIDPDYETIQDSKLYLKLQRMGICPFPVTFNLEDEDED